MLLQCCCWRAVSVAVVDSVVLSVFVVVVAVAGH